MENFNIRLRRLREGRGYKIREIAQLVGIPETTYREWEYGRTIRGEPYQKLAKALGVGLQELLTGEKPDQKKVLRQLELLQTQIVKLQEEVLLFF